MAGMACNGFTKATSDNLPKVDMFMVGVFMKKDDRFNAAEIRGAKVQKIASRESYGDNAIGYVQVKRDGPLCTVIARICPEHKVRSKAYTVQVDIEESKEEISNIQCHDCAAAAGGCKHSLALLMWLHRRSEEPSPTGIECYWQKPQMSKVGTAVKYVEVRSFAKVSLNLPPLGNFVEDLLGEVQSRNLDCQLSGYSYQAGSGRNMSIWQLAMDFNTKPVDQSVECFLNYARTMCTLELCERVEAVTRNQSDSPLWHEMRYARITASKLFEAAHCSTDGALVEMLIGHRKLKASKAMARGIQLEKDICKALEKEMRVKIMQSGLILIPEYPVLGASPDGITNEYVVEIKCPMSKKAFRRYLKDDTELSSKCKAQINLQMFAAGKKKGLFCVADPKFEENKKITYVRVEYDEMFLKDLIKNAMIFWKQNIFHKIMSSVSK